MKLGVVGLGVIGKAVVKAADEGRIPVEIPVATTRTLAKVKDFLAALDNPPRMTDLAGVAQEADVVMEASGGETVEAICLESFAREKDVIINSVGALLERDDLIEEAKRKVAVYSFPRAPLSDWTASRGLPPATWNPSP